LLQGNALPAHAGKQISLLCSPLAVQCEIEGGGKWPQDAKAVRQLKLAFLLRVHDVLRTKLHIKSVPREHCLDVLTDGFVFRVSVVADLEVERRLLPSAAVAAAGPYAVYPRECVERGVVYPLYCNAVKAFVARFPSFASSVRLLASWLDGHCFSGCLPHEAVEMVVASVYAEPDAGHTPTSPSAGFRAALHRLAHFDWEGEPLVVDIAQPAELSVSDRAAITAAFQAARKGRRSDALYIVTSADKPAGLAPCSRMQGVQAAVASMVVAEARQSLLLLTAWVEDPASSSSDSDAALDEVMRGRSAMDRCNVTLQFTEGLINNKAVKARRGNDWLEQMQRGAPYARLKVFSNMSKAELTPDNLVVKEGSMPTPVQAEVVESLRRGFGDVALFFWNAQHGVEVGVMWKPAAFLTKKFSILEARNKMSMASTAASAASVTVMNTSEMAAQMVSCGEGLLSKVNFL
jgi:U3 small nucleolar RNA-associated protein 22